MDAFSNFLSSVGSGLQGDTDAQMKDYSHASHLYVDGRYARLPKFSHLYFVTFNFNDGVIRDAVWAKSGAKDVGLLVKQISLPKFKIATEVMNQYNRKTVVQSKLSYDPVTMEFHDDNSEITNGLWKNYYKYYYADSTYGGADDYTAREAPKQSSIGAQLFGGLNFGNKIRGQKTGKIGNTAMPQAYTDTKYGEKQYPYGLDSLQDKSFFKSIDIFVLHQQKFTQITLVNPKITEWAHDDVSQGDTKPMRNKMTVVYENVFYNQGKIGKNTDSGLFAAIYYDKSASPLSISGKGTKSIFGQGGVISGIGDVFGEDGALAQGNYLQAALQSATLIKNASQISPEAVSAAGYNLLGTAVGTLASGNNQSGVSTGDRLSASLSSAAGIGVYTNQYATSNLTDVEALPAKTQTAEATGTDSEADASKEKPKTIIDWLKEKLFTKGISLDEGSDPNFKYTEYTDAEFKEQWKALMKQNADEDAALAKRYAPYKALERAQEQNSRTR